MAMYETNFPSSKSDEIRTCSNALCNVPLSIYFFTKFSLEEKIQHKFNNLNSQSSNLNSIDYFLEIENAALKKFPQKAS